MRSVAPASQVLEYQSIEYNGSLSATNPYKGSPSPELDAAWSELLSPMNVRTSNEELRRMNKSSIALGDGSGFMAVLDVYHRLHCVKYLRHYIHAEYYNVSDLYIPEHVDHCLDSIRQALMCNPDLSLVTFDWLPDYEKPWPNFDGKHECADWGKVHDWAQGRSFDIFQKGLIVHPELGPSWPNGDDHLDG
ncbi:hypothetical protein MBLNU459_g4192t1 [Dothideomycetes sp. NU459]